MSSVPFVLPACPFSKQEQCQSLHAFDQIPYHLFNGKSRSLGQACKKRIRGHTFKIQNSVNQEGKKLALSLFFLLSWSFLFLRFDYENKAGAQGKDHGS
jgi:hypothetical protein